MITQIIFTQNELVEMLQGKEVPMVSRDGSDTIFSMEKETLKWNYKETDEPLITRLTKKETNELLKGKKTPNQIRAERGFPPVNDCALNKVNEYAQDITLMQHRALSPDEFLKKHCFLKVDDVFDLLLEDMINETKGEK